MFFFYASLRRLLPAADASRPGRLRRRAHELVASRSAEEEAPLSAAARREEPLHGHAAQRPSAARATAGSACARGCGARGSAGGIACRSGDRCQETSAGGTASEAASWRPGLALFKAYVQSCRRPSARTAAQDSRGNVMLQVAEEGELQVEAGSFCSAILQEFIMAP